MRRVPVNSLHAITLAPMALCPLCTSRKGKRACPAKGASICSICCGEKRVVEIACPSDCVYLSAGVENEVRREAIDYLQHQEHGKKTRWFRAVEELGPLLSKIEQAVAGAPIRNLEDRELLEALTSARKTFESEAKGVILEDLPELPTLQALYREIVNAVREFQAWLEAKRRDLQPGGPDLPTIGPAEAVECISVMIDRCEYHIRRKDEAGALVQHLRRTYPPDPRKRAGIGSSIILP